MTALYSAAIGLFLAFSFILPACSGNTTANPHSAKVYADTSPVITQQPYSTQNPETEKNDLVNIYSRAIGDYIRLVNKQYKLTFDTLFFGKHVYGQPDDFPDIVLPASIESTNIKLVSPEQGKKIQQERKSSFYINLIGWVNSGNANFTFVTFSNGFAHQFDCFIKYEYNNNKKKFVFKASRFENYQYKAT